MTRNLFKPNRKGIIEGETEDGFTVARGQVAALDKSLSKLHDECPKYSKHLKGLTKNELHIYTELSNDASSSDDHPQLKYLIGNASGTLQKVSVEVDEHLSLFDECMPKAIKKLSSVMPDCKEAMKRRENMADKYVSYYKTLKEMEKNREKLNYAKVDKQAADTEKLRQDFLTYNQSHVTELNRLTDSRLDYLLPSIECFARSQHQTFSNVLNTYNEILDSLPVTDSPSDSSNHVIEQRLQRHMSELKALSIVDSSS